MEELIMRVFCNISVKELLAMERSYTAFIFLIDAIKELAENESANVKVKNNKLILFQKLLETYPELPFYKFAELFQVVGKDLSDEDYQRLVTLAFHR